MPKLAYQAAHPSLLLHTHRNTTSTEDTMDTTTARPSRKRQLVIAAIGGLTVAVVALVAVNAHNMSVVGEYKVQAVAAAQNLASLSAANVHTVTSRVPVTVTESTTVTVYEAVTPEAPAPIASFPDGSYLIGSEMPAGNYTSSGAGETCVWLIFDASHQPVDSGFGRVASVPSSGYSFESSDCGTWSRT